jgi:flavin prenyltransferase
MNYKEKIIVAITGASGAIYAVRLLQRLLQTNVQVELIVSTDAFSVINQENVISTGCKKNDYKKKIQDFLEPNEKQLQIYDNDNFFNPPASGSSIADKMVIIPCSCATLSAIATGLSNNLIRRAADCVIKEKKQLILVPRETPFSSIHLENMLKLSNLGVCILPPNPAFYFKPKSVNEIIDFVIDRILQQLNIKTTTKKWKP